MLFLSFVYSILAIGNACKPCAQIAISTHHLIRDHMEARLDKISKLSFNIAYLVQNAYFTLHRQYSKYPVYAGFGAVNCLLLQIYMYHCRKELSYSDRSPSITN